MPHNLLKEFYIYKSVDDEFIIEENLYFNLDEYSSAYENDVSGELDGKAKWNLNLNIYFAPIEMDMNSNDYTLEFGTTKNQETYVNIYIDPHCIGTCYYECKSFEFVRRISVKGKRIKLKPPCGIYPQGGFFLFVFF